MNRRDFLASATAAAALPALPAFSLSSPAPAAVSSARYWAIYMTELNGDVTPATLSKMTGITTAKAAELRSGLIAQSVLKPTAFAAHNPIGTAPKPTDLLKKAGKALEQLTQDDPEAPQDSTPPADQA